MISNFLSNSKLRSSYFVRMASYTTDSNRLLEIVWNSIPKLTKQMHKGQNGRIGIIGGSLEYTGAPYFAAMSALRTGADGTHIFCMKDAAIPIKSYSPELIVHPILDSADPVNDFLEWLPRLHVLVLGPGLGRRPQIFSTLGHILQMAKDYQIPVVLDADALYYLNNNYDVIEGYDKAVLTPNIMEMTRLYKSICKENVETNKLEAMHVEKVAKKLGVTILCKGPEDIITTGDATIVCNTEGSYRRCMGQGDVLSGACAIFLFWMTKCQNQGLPNTCLAAWGACDLTRRTANKTFAKLRSSMLTTDIINMIGSVCIELTDLSSR